MRKLMAALTSAIVTVSLTAQADNTTEHIQELKREILEIAFEAQGAGPDSDDNSLEVRQRLDPLIDELVSLVPARTEQEKMKDIIGSWYQVWSDGPGELSGPGALADAIWQVVFPEGYLWNVARSQSGTIKSMTYLRGTFTINSNSLSEEFTKAVFNSDWSFSEPTRLAMLAEWGAFDSHPAPYPPNLNPVGKKRTLINVYVDEDIRICKGGGGDFGEETSLYILERD